MTASGGRRPVQVFVDLTRFAATATRAQLRDRVRELEDVGATGVSVSDHIFFTSDGRPRTDGVGHGCDPLTTLAVVAGLSERLAVQTVVVNSAWVHAGLAMPKFRTRIDRLAEVLAVARTLWTDGTVSLDGNHVVARDLPLSPVPDRPPRLLVGGGSDRLLELAGRFADLLDRARRPEARARRRYDHGAGLGRRRGAAGAHHGRRPRRPHRTRARRRGGRRPPA
ncbi:MAG TPA: LLM class flavin-dependent oxidoreductase [Pseudonocardia sp.]|nr:LLM class flavin-dependent oxidoreductase [Pseudonocardia sp.]